MNETRIWYCDICHRTLNFKSKPKHLNSKFHKHKEKLSVVVEEYEFDKPVIQKLGSIFDKVIKDCHGNYFFIFEFIFVYVIECTNIRKI